MTLFTHQAAVALMDSRLDTSRFEGRALVVGGGIAGLATAAQLAQEGLKARLSGWKPWFIQGLRGDFC